MTSMMNPVTNKEYTGAVNKFILQTFATKYNWHDHRWCTYAQAKAKGWHVKAGEKGTKIEFWSMYDTKSRRILSIGEANKLLLEDANAKKRIRMVAKSYVVFNAEQIEGIPLLEKSRSSIAPSEQITLKKIETIAGGMGVPIENKGNVSLYNKTRDVIYMPPLDKFVSVSDYAAVLLHELSHSTMHPSRLNRSCEGEFKLEARAKEELRAEISSVFMMSELDLTYGSQHLDNHKAYIQSWIELLENNPEELFQAIKEAEKIQEYMMELCPDKIVDKQREFTDKCLSDRILEGISKAKSNTERNSMVHDMSHEREII